MATARISRDDRGVGVDDHFGLAAAQPGDFHGLVEALLRPDPGMALGGRHEAEPDALALEAADQGDTATLEQLALGTGEPTRCGECTWKAGEGGWRGSHAL